jgi:hypothetical protein
MISDDYFVSLVATAPYAEIGIPNRLGLILRGFGLNKLDPLFFTAFYISV